LDIEIDFTNELNRRGVRAEIYNVGCMYWGYEPVTLDEILAHGPTISPYYGMPRDVDPIEGEINGQVVRTDNG